MSCQWYDIVQAWHPTRERQRDGKAKALGLPGVALAVAHKILTAVKGLWIRSSPWLMLVRHRVR